MKHLFNCPNCGTEHAPETKTGTRLCSKCGESVQGVPAIAARYEVQTEFIYGWENVWRVDDELQYFSTFQSALDAIREAMQDRKDAKMDRDRYRIVAM
ncbi:hypothetical protein [Kiloniella sp.]|uniref:hypothetical protein n=1 Tax=Kiloniella sp. TaxID=1938587 RepID=UPI003B0250DC